MIEPLREFAHSKFLLAQRVYRYTESIDFEKACERLSEDERKQFRKWIDHLDLEPLKRKVKELLLDDLHTLSYAQLRTLGKHHHVKYWHTLQKDALICGIEQARKHENSINNKHQRTSDTDEGTSSEVGDL